MLHSLGRGKCVSQSALAAILEEVANLPELPAARSRPTIKRSRDDALDINTPFGTLLLSQVAPLAPTTAGGKEELFEFTFVNPLVWMYHLCATCTQYADLVKNMFQTQEPTLHEPWQLICYADEITPGNVLKGGSGNQRKIQAIYWSWKQHGIQQLAHERLWFVLGVARSDIVKRLPGKMSQFFKMAVLHFFCPTNIRQGVVIMLPGSERKIIFGKLGVLLGDEGALKEILDMKGAAGTVPCPLCRNITDHKGQLASFDDTGTSLPSTNLDLSRVEFHTDESILDIMRFLKENRPTASKAAFKRMQQFMGFNYNEDGALLCQELDLKPASSLMWDWMHTYVSCGIWNAEVGLLLSQLRAAGFTSRDLHNELQTFRWPRAISSRSITGKNVFSKEQVGDVTCSASEALSLYSVLRFILLDRIKKGQLREAKPAITSYINLCRVLDLLQNIKKGATRASTLEAAILTHLQSYLVAYNDTRFLPKHHYSTHLGRMLNQHQLLCSCFCLERKHRFIKRYAGIATNISTGWEKGVLSDALIFQLQDMNDREGDPWTYGLRSPSEPSEVMSLILHGALGQTGQAKVSRDAFFAPGASCSIGDVCLLSLEGRQHVGQIIFFC